MGGPPRYRDAHARPGPGYFATLATSRRRLLRCAAGARGGGAAGDGLEGVRLASESAYDVILLDVMLPGLNGYEVCAHLRATGDRTIPG